MVPGKQKENKKTKQKLSYTFDHNPLLLKMSDTGGDDYMGGGGGGGDFDFEAAGYVHIYFCVVMIAKKRPVQLWRLCPSAEPNPLCPLICMAKRLLVPITG